MPCNDGGLKCRNSFCESYFLGISCSSFLVAGICKNAGTFERIILGFADFLNQKYAAWSDPLGALYNIMMFH